MYEHFKIISFEIMNVNTTEKKKLSVEEIFKKAILLTAGDYSWILFLHRVIITRQEGCRSQYVAELTEEKRHILKLCTGKCSLTREGSPEQGYHSPPCVKGVWILFSGSIWNKTKSSLSLYLDHGGYTSWVYSLWMTTITILENKWMKTFDIPT